MFIIKKYNFKIIITLFIALLFSFKDVYSSECSSEESSEYFSLKSHISSDQDLTGISAEISWQDRSLKSSSRISSSRKKYFLLTIDGGGIRGIFAASFLAKLEKALGKPIAKTFHFMAGTSTGGIIVIGLGIPDKTGKNPKYTAEEILGLYVQNSKSIFKKSKNPLGPKYKSKGIKNILEQYFGNTKLSSALIPTVVTAYDTERSKPFSLNSHHCDDEEYFQLNKVDFYSKDAARATAAAPTFFPAAEIYAVNDNGIRKSKKKSKKSKEKSKKIRHASRYTFIDGGIFANNPSQIGLFYASKLKDIDPRDLYVVSLSTGEKAGTISSKQAKTWGILGWARHILDVMFTSSSRSTELNVKGMLKDHYFRFSPTLKHSKPAMDKLGKNIDNLLKDAQEMMEDNEDEFKRLLSILKDN